MRLCNKLKLTLMASAVVLAFGASPAMAAGTQAFGSFRTSATGRLHVTGNGHASVSVAQTLSINEERAISF